MRISDVFNDLFKQEPFSCSYNHSENATLMHSNETKASDNYARYYETTPLAQQRLDVESFEKKVRAIEPHEVTENYSTEGFHAEMQRSPHRAFTQLSENLIRLSRKPEVDSTQAAATTLATAADGLQRAKNTVNEKDQANTFMKETQSGSRALVETVRTVIEQDDQLQTMPDPVEDIADKVDEVTQSTQEMMNGGFFNILQSFNSWLEDVTALIDDLSVRISVSAVININIDISGLAPFLELVQDSAEMVAGFLENIGFPSDRGVVPILKTVMQAAESILGLINNAQEQTPPAQTPPTQTQTLAVRIVVVF